MSQLRHHRHSAALNRWTSDIRRLQQALDGHLADPSRSAAVIRDEFQTALVALYALEEAVCGNPALEFTWAVDRGASEPL